MGRLSLTERFRECFLDNQYVSSVLRNEYRYARIKVSQAPGAGKDEGRS